MSGGFALLWSKILDSSIWRLGSKEARLVWITMLAMKDAQGIVHSSLVGLADRARVTREECEEAIAEFTSPDPEDTSGVENGVKIRKVPGGWFVINHDLYRFSTEAKREFWRQQKAEQRAKEEASRNKRKKPKQSPALSGNFTHDESTGETGLADINTRFGFDPNEPPKCRANPGEACQWSECPWNGTDPDCPLAVAHEEWMKGKQ